MCNSCSDGSPVCVFDSGIGGLNLLAACVGVCPDRSFVYFADNFNVPYGNLAPERIKELAFSAFEKIAALNPAAAVVACNTVTSVCITDLRAKYSFPIIGIQPAVKQAVAEKGECLVLATPATVGSASFRALCARSGGNIAVHACPGLAEYIEEHVSDYPFIDVSPFLPPERPSAVVLGCTHYIFSADSIKKTYCCPIFDGILGTADHLGKILGNCHKNSFINQKIQFIGGDTAKNKAIFDLLTRRH